MRLRNIKTSTIATYDADEEPDSVPATEDADIVNVFVKGIGINSNARRYEFMRNPPNWRASDPDYIWKAYRRTIGPVGWVVQED